MKRTAYLLLILTITVLFAREIPKDTSRLAAELYLDNPIFAETISYGEQELADVYVSDKDGYVIVPLHRRFRPILAHSDESIYRPAHPENILRKIVIADMTEKLNAEFPKDLQDNNETLWDALEIGDRAGLRRILDYDQYGPWIDVNWGQGEPYNAYCPMDPETGERCVTGCVQTAAAMNLYYWEYPPSIELSSSDSYYSTGTSPSIYIDAPPLSMDEIHYGQDHTARMDNDQIARLMAAIGVLTQANYASEGTSADIEDYHYEERMGYVNARDTSPLSGSYFEDMAEDLRAGRPIQMSMFDMGAGGHSINCDGWNTADEFHLNMGWGGYENGWYHLETELPSTYDWLTRTTIRITAPPKPDVSNFCESAKGLIVKDIQKKTINGLTSDADVDWYYFHASADSLYTFYTTGPFDTWCEIIDNCGEEPLVYSDDGGDMGNFTVTFRPERTSYHYIKIGGRDSDENVNYRLWFSKSGAPPRPFLQILYPNGNGMYEGGEEMGIYFTRGGEPAVELVKMEYSVSGRVGPWHTIADSLRVNNFRWTVPTLEEDAWHCWLRISDTEDFGIRDYIDEKFVIRGPADIEENKPDRMNVSTYPNPFNSTVNIELPEGIKSCQILDLEGRRIAETGSSWSPSSDVPSGKYIIAVPGYPRTEVLYNK